MSFKYANLDDEQGFSLVLIERFPTKETLESTIKDYIKMLSTSKPLILCTESTDGKLSFQTLDKNDDILFQLEKDTLFSNQVPWKVFD